MDRGITNSDDAGRGAFSVAEGLVEAGFEAWVWFGAVDCANREPPKSETTTKLEKQRGNFTAGVLLEPARFHPRTSITEARVSSNLCDRENQNQVW